MVEAMGIFESFVRSGSTSYGLNTSESTVSEAISTHPFDERNIHPEIGSVSQRLFDDGHYAHATLEAFKIIEQTVKKLSLLELSGQKLMMDAFSDRDPKIQINALSNQSDKDEQTGYKFMFAGAMSGIRNPRAHETIRDDIETCLDHLSIASALLRKLDTVK